MSRDMSNLDFGQIDDKSYNNVLNDLVKLLEHVSSYLN